MKTIREVLALAAVAVLVCATRPQSARAATYNPCPTFPAGSTITEPENLFSHNGVLRISLSYETGVDENGNATFCYLDCP